MDIHMQFDFFSSLLFQSFQRKTKRKYTQTAQVCSAEYIHVFLKKKKEYGQVGATQVHCEHALFNMHLK